MYSLYVYVLTYVSPLQGLLDAYLAGTLPYSILYVWVGKQSKQAERSSICIPHNQSCQNVSMYYVESIFS